MTEAKQVLVGVGVFIKKDGKYILGKRKNCHGAGQWALPGGHLEFGETPEQCAAREVMEEVGITLKNIVPLTYTNDFIEGKHYVTLFLAADYDAGEVTLKEPEKCEGWELFTLNEIPEPRFCMEEILKWVKEL